MSKSDKITPSPQNITGVGNIPSAEAIGEPLVIQDNETVQLKAQIQTLTKELLQERITRIDYQVQLLTQWRQKCQQELNQLVAIE